MRGLRALPLLLLAALPVMAETPSMSTSVIGLQLSFDDCKSRVSSALRSRGYERTFDFGNGWIGTNDRYSSSVGCIHGNKETVLNVVVASNDANTNAERDRIVDLVRGGGDDKPRGRAIGWGDSPRGLGLRGQSGRFTYTCAGSGTAGAAWGTDVYTDDSSICTAAAHAGAISITRGGTVTIELLPGRRSYAGSQRNGVGSSSYGPWDYSFAVAGGGGGERGDPGSSTISWSENARAWRGQNGERVRLRCPSGGNTNATVWGSRIYTDDSAVCVAAVHAGEISAARGGQITIEIRSGRSSYEASSRNGVSTRSYGSWDGSFVFVP